MKFEIKDKVEIVENAFAYVLVMAMFAYGIGKMVQFDVAMQSNKTVAQMTGMELMWAFYGYSKPFVFTLGILEITGGILILIKRTRLVGCILVSTILVNIILQDIFYKVNPGALIAAIIYQSLIIVIFWFNKDVIIQCLKWLLNRQKSDDSRKKFYVKFFLSILLFVILRIMEFYLTTKW